MTDRSSDSLTDTLNRASLSVVGQPARTDGAERTDEASSYLTLNPASNASRAGGQKDSVSISLHGPGVTIDATVKAGEALVNLLGVIGDEIGEPDVTWTIQAVYFKCDGCGLQRPDRPSPDEGWTYSDGDDFCPACSPSPSSVVSPAKAVNG